jgi:hypothetical protein
LKQAKWVDHCGAVTNGKNKQRFGLGLAQIAVFASRQ